MTGKRTMCDCVESWESWELRTSHHTWSTLASISSLSALLQSRQKPSLSAQKFMTCKSRDYSKSQRMPPLATLWRKAFRICNKETTLIELLLDQWNNHQCLGKTNASKLRLPLTLILLIQIEDCSGANWWPVRMSRLPSKSLAGLVSKAFGLEVRQAWSFGCAEQSHLSGSTATTTGSRSSCLSGFCTVRSIAILNFSRSAWSFATCLSWLPFSYGITR